MPVQGCRLRLAVWIRAELSRGCLVRPMLDRACSVWPVLDRACSGWPMLDRAWLSQAQASSKRISAYSFYALSCRKLRVQECHVSHQSRQQPLEQAHHLKNFIGIAVTLCRLAQRVGRQPTRIRKNFTH